MIVEIEAYTWNRSLLYLHVGTDVNFSKCMSFLSILLKINYLYLFLFFSWCSRYSFIVFHRTILLLFAVFEEKKFDPYG